MTLSHKPLWRAPSLGEAIARQIGAEIREGRVKPGERLPTEQNLCAAYGVSRAVVREAVSRLKSEGLLVSFQGRGLFVAEEAASASFRMEPPDLDDKRELQHIIELLMALEGQAAAIAATRRSLAELERIRAQLDGMARAIAEGRNGVDEDLGFHTEIAKATQNPIYTSLLTYLENRVRNLIRTARANTARIEGLAAEVQAEHQAIYEAIAARQPEAAKRAAEAHLLGAARRLALYRRDAARGD